MKRSINSFVAFFILLLAVVSVEAGTKVVIEVEIIKADNIEKSTEIITFDEKRFRLDLPGTDEINAPETPYIMTVDGGENWVIGDRPKDRFYCSQMQTEEFFKNMGTQVTDAIEFFNVKADEPTVKKSSRNRAQRSRDSKQHTCSSKPTPEHMHGFYLLNSSTR